MKQGCALGQINSAKEELLKEHLTLNSNFKFLNFCFQGQAVKNLPRVVMRASNSAQIA
jgi:hypothetical protein